MRDIAVAGATGTLGSRIAGRLSAGHHPIRPIARSAGVDLNTGKGLKEALTDIEVLVDASNTFPTDSGADLVNTLVGAARRLVEAAQLTGVQRIVSVSIVNVENPVFDEYPYYVAKRGQEKIFADSELQTTIVKTTQWHEFATNPAAVTFHQSEVLAEDWLIQPIAADTVAEIVVTQALAPSSSTRIEFTGPERIRLPELTKRLLSVRRDPRQTKVVPASLPDLSTGALLAPPTARIVGPTVEEWLRAQAS